MPLPSTHTSATTSVANCSGLEIKRSEGLNGKEVDRETKELEEIIIATVEEKEMQAAGECKDKAKNDLKRKWRLKHQKGWRWRLQNKAFRDQTLTEAEEKIDIEMGNATLPSSFLEIKRLLRIQKHPIYCNALGEWLRKEALLIDRTQRKKSVEAGAKDIIFQMIGWFLAIQSFLFTGVVGSNLLHCNNKLYPILISIVASIVTISGIALKMIQIKEIQEITRNQDGLPLEVIQHKLNALRREGIENFLFAEYEYLDNGADPVSKAVRFFSCAVIGCLLVFAVIFPLAFRNVLCHPGSNPYAATVPSSK